MELNDFSREVRVDVQAIIHKASFHTEQSNRNKVMSKTNSFSKQTNKNCPFCYEIHRPHECQNNATITSQLKMPKKKELFQKCLKKHDERFSLAASFISFTRKVPQKP